MLEIARRTYDRRALAGSYLSHGKSDLREQVQRAADGRPKRKKLFTVLRALLSTEHFHRMGALPTFQPDPGSEPEPEPEPEPGSEPELEQQSASVVMSDVASVSSVWTESTGGAGGTSRTRK